MVPRLGYEEEGAFPQVSSRGQKHGLVGFGLRVWLDGTLGYIDFGAPAEGQADWGTQSLGHRAWLPVLVRVKGLYYYHQYLRMAEVGGILN